MSLSNRLHIRRLKNESDLVYFSKLKLADQQGTIWFPYSLVRRKLFDRIGQAIRSLHNFKLILGKGNLYHLKRVGSFWEKYGLSDYQSTGFYFVTCAIVLCEEVNLFGFWPFGKALDGRNVSSHYYDQTKLTTHHDMPYEWTLLLSMHHYGLLKLHNNNCSTNTLSGD